MARNRAWQAPRAFEPTAEEAGLRWEVWDEEQPAHHLYHGNLYVGEAYGIEREDGVRARWRSAVTDFRSSEESFEKAKDALLRDYLRHLAFT